MTVLSSVGPLEETPIDRYLAAQADLTAVERFAQRHEAELLPRQARYYRDLIPMARPEPGQQYGFGVDLDACTGCKACVTACHSLNGLDDDESWRSVTVLGDGRQTVTSACHHCVDPACLKGCPVDAYEKDVVTGIVAHLDDQCIGCSYCTLMCPYDVPAYNPARGIVRKCDMCRDRLAAGEAPACVQACPNAAITVELVAVATVPATSALVAGAPPSSITRPTTVYRSRRAATGDDSQLPAVPHAAVSHAPLVVMLVLTQLSVGTFAADLVVGSGGTSAFVATVAALAGMVGLGASLLHLGRPRYFYRAVLGVRHSWLSREVVAFGGFAGLASLHVLALWANRPVPWAAAAVTLAGGAAVACSVMVYVATRRRSWHASRVAMQFARTAAIGGLATVLWASAVTGGPVFQPRAAILTLVLFGVVWRELLGRDAFFAPAGAPR